MTRRMMKTIWKEVYRMPSINRIRIFNVFYNDRKDYFEDLQLNAFGDDMLIEMFNGGGKSLILQCIAQTVLPNSMIQDEWEFKKLFSKTNNNNNIHIMVEWNLDEGMEHKYMIAGFCAYKDDSRDDETNDEEKGDRIKNPLYFNYICLYDEPNQYDIAEFPLLQRDSENRTVSKMNHKDLRRLLRSIKSDKYYTEIFDTTRNYHQRLSQYYINPVEWDILREVNADEKFVAKVFREKKTAKDFLLKFLVPKVEKCYANQVSNDYQDNEALADSLLNLRTQLDELIQKKEQISEYDYCIELVQKLVTSLENIRLAQEKREHLHGKIGSHLNYLSKMQTELEVLHKRLIQEHQSLLNEEKRLSMNKDSLEIHEKNLELQKLVNIETEALEVKNSLEEKIESDTAKFRLMKAENGYYQYIATKSKIDQEMHKLKDMEKNNEEQTGERKALGRKIYTHLTKKIAEYGVELDNQENAQSKIQEEIKTKTDSVINYNSNIRSFKRSIEEKESQANQILDEIVSGKYEDIAGYAKSQDTIDKLYFEVEVAKIEIKSTEKVYTETKELAHTLEMQLNTLENEFSNIRNVLKEKNKEFEQIHKETEILKGLCKKYDKDNFIELKIFIIEEQKKGNLKIAELESAITKLEKYIESLLNNSIRVNTDTYDVLDILKVKFNSADLGMEFLESFTTEDKKHFLDKNPLLPYAILLNDRDFNAFKTDSTILSNYNGGAIPIVNMGIINELDMFKTNTIFTIKDTDFFVNEDRIKEEMIKQESILSEKQDEQDELKKNSEIISEDFEAVNRFLSRYNEDSEEELFIEIISKKEELDKYEKRCNSVKAQIEEANQKILNLNADLERLNDTVKIKNHALSLLCEYIQLHNDEKKIREIIQNTIRDKDQNEKLLVEEKAKLESMESDKRDIGNRIIDIRTKIKSVELYKKEFEVFGADADQNPISDREYQDLLAAYKSVDGMLGGLLVNISDIENRISEYKTACDAAENSIRAEKHLLDDFGYINLLDFTQHSIEEINNVDTSIEKTRENLKASNNDFSKKQNKRNKLQWQIEKDENGFLDKYKAESKKTANQILDENYGIDINVVINEYITLLQENKVEIDEKNSKIKDTEDIIEKTKSEFYEFKSLVDSEHIDLKKISEAVAADEACSDMKNELQYVRGRVEKFQKEYHRIIRDSEAKIQNTHIYAFRSAIEDIKNIPQNSMELQDRIERLAGNGNAEQNNILDLLATLKDQITEDIKNLEKQELNFVDLCVQKCTNIYRDLKKLQSISRIDFMGRKQDILEINIKRLPDEDCNEKMKNYIEQIIEKGRETLSDKDRRTYVVNGLSTERLLPQILENIKHDSVRVYKIEDVYNDSKNRFLNWQEAVGSKGQTNSMYICVFICVMTFLRRLQTVNTNNSNIFLMLDNPFAGTSTEDLWVGILELIKQNNIQFFSVGHEVKGQLANCFATRYILEKERRRNAEYTVVIDFKSKYDLRMLEYHPLNGKHMSEQISFDI